MTAAGPLSRSGAGVVLTFDDGCVSSGWAASALEARGMRGTFYVLGNASRAVQNDCAYLNTAGILALAAKGHDVEPHTMSHAHLSQLPLEMAQQEMAEAQVTLSSLTGRKLSHFAYPYGETTPEVTREAAKRFTTARLFYDSFDQMPLDYPDPALISSIGVLSTTTPAEVGRWLDMARERNVLLVLAFHDITGDPERYETNQQNFLAILDLIASRPERVMTMAEAFGSSSQIRFHPHGGNEWWVEVSVSGVDAAKLARVQARDAGDAWVDLAYKPWGAFAGSVRIEPGHTVAFRAVLTDSRLVESCAFTHPGGVCAGILDAVASANTGTGAPPVPTASTFTASFSRVRGNAWWVESEVRGAGAPFAGVDARVNGGAWTELALTSWGTWAKSMPAPAGTYVELRARATDGQSVVSPKYSWPPS